MVHLLLLGNFPLRPLDRESRRWTALESLQGFPLCLKNRRYADSDGGLLPSFGGSVLLGRAQFDRFSDLLDTSTKVGGEGLPGTHSFWS
jgi:hypothetical protein